jgi:hypothetical protein
LRENVRVYLDYPEVKDLMRIVLYLIKIRLPWVYGFDDTELP